MIVVIDANILISSILNPKGNIPEILLSESNKIEFAAPSLIKDEVEAAKKKLCAAGKMSETYFQRAADFFYSGILFFSPQSISMPDIEKAWNLTKKIDKKDTLYVALTIALDAMLWSGDLRLYRYLRRNGFMSVVTTKELLQIIQGV